MVWHYRCKCMIILCKLEILLHISYGEACQRINLYINHAEYIYLTKATYSVQPA